MASQFMRFARLQYLTAAAMAGALCTVLPTPSHAAETSPMQAAAPTEDTSIRPFPKVHFSDEALQDLHRRIAATSWPSPELGPDATQGVQIATLKKLFTSINATTPSV